MAPILITEGRITAIGGRGHFMLSGKGILLRRAVLTAALAGGLGAGAATAATAATHGCTLSASVSTTSATSSSMPIHTCPNIPAAPPGR
jgi:hypothetical protein